MVLAVLAILLAPSYCECLARIGVFAGVRRATVPNIVSDYSLSDQETAMYIVANVWLPTRLALARNLTHLTHHAASGSLDLFLASVPTLRSPRVHSCAHSCAFLPQAPCDRLWATIENASHDSYWRAGMKLKLGDAI